MNYSYSLQVVCSINQILTHLENTESSVLALRIKCFVDERIKEALNKTNTKTTWETTTSEWEYITTLKGIVHTLENNKPCDIPNILISLREKITEDMPPVKIAFFTQEYYVWPSFQSIWEYCQSQNDCETRLVYVYSNGAKKPLKDENYYRNIFEYRNNGYPLMEMTDFHLDRESPDIVFYMKPYYELRACPPKFYVNEIIKHTPYTVFISYCLDVQGGNKLIRFFYGMPAFFHMWIIIAYSRYYESMMKQYGYRNGENAVRLGHPKFDFTYRALVKREFQRPEWAKKIKGRSVVLWNTHFSVEANGGVGTYFIWKDTIFGYFQNNKDIVLLWRPHPIFWQTISQQPGFNSQEFSQFLDNLRASDNVIVDDTSDYRFAFSMSHALISDAATFLVEYCGTGQPVLYTPKETGEFIINEDYLKGIETATTREQIIGFLDRVKKHDKTGAEKRQTYFREQFGESDGKNGQRIYEHIIKAMIEDCQNRAIKLVSGKCDITRQVTMSVSDDYLEGSEGGSN